MSWASPSAAASGRLAGRVLRIGHLGDLNESMPWGALGTLEIVLRRQGVPLGEGALPPP